MCKVFERIVKEQMLGYLCEHCLITRHQHGFLSRHSTTTELLETLNDWTLALRNKHVVDAIYFDFRKPSIHWYTANCKSNCKAMVSVASYTVFCPIFCVIVFSVLYYLKAYHLTVSLLVVFHRGAF